jgi:hypothetical protein
MRSTADDILNSMHRDGWRFVAWLLILSALFRAPIVLRSCNNGPLRPTEVEPIIEQ